MTRTAHVFLSHIRRFAFALIVAGLAASSSGCAVLAGAAAGGAVGYVAGSEAGEDEAREELDEDED